MEQIATFMMFDGNAEEAINFYLSIFPNSGIESISRYGENAGGQSGKVLHAVFTLNGTRFMCIDSVVKHEFGFTPAMSVHVSCETEQEVDTFFAKLSEGGQILMALDAYPFSKKYAWFNDKFGVSWQLACQ
jgi:predicted 3-demethylubiquinone-9 3-methyltransferase (glyoxalase superfamily)